MTVGKAGTGRIVAPLAGRLLLGACLFGGCGDSVGPEDSGKVNLSFAARGAPAAKPVVDAEGNTLDITKAEIVLREIELKREGGSGDCDSAAADDGCERVALGPVLVNVPLDGTAPQTALEAPLSEGRWKEVEFDVHKLDPSEPGDAALLNATGFPEKISIRVTGTWQPAGGAASSFVFTTDLDYEQEIEFEPPLVVGPGETTNVTFLVNVDAWFRSSDGRFVHPATANKDGANEDLVKNNIKASIEGFEDDDRDGEDD